MTAAKDILNALRSGVADDIYGQPKIPMDLLEAVWRKHRAAILADWIENWPGSRPWAWWEFDAPEPRRVISGEEDPQAGFPPWNETGQRWYYFGVPSPWQKPPPDYEEEFDYLDRLNLLLPGDCEEEE